MFNSDTLHKLIDAEEWDKVVQRIDSHPAEVRKLKTINQLHDSFKKSSALALHHALAMDAPINVITKLLDSHERSIMFPETAYKRLPLTLACYHKCNKEVVLELIRRYPAAAKEPDTLGRLPIHVSTLGVLNTECKMSFPDESPLCSITMQYALANQHPQEVQEELFNAFPEAVRKPDHRGWLPLHIAVGAGAPLLICLPLVEAYPESLLIACKEGYIPLEVAKTYKDWGEDVDDEMVEFLERETPLERPQRAMPKANKKKLFFRRHKKNNGEGRAVVGDRA
jgi:hypothetical protein